MKKILATILILSSSFAYAGAEDTNPYNSLSTAVLEIQKRNYAGPENTNTTQSAYKTDNNLNSLPRAVLRKQGVAPHLVVTSKSRLSATTYERNQTVNSLFEGVLAKHYFETQHLN
jgi:hypothetical protein